MLTAIVAAAGRGRRFGAPENKLFASLAGRTVLHWTLENLQRTPAVDAILLVAGQEDLERVREIARGFGKTCGVCSGGAERSDSVWNALGQLPDGTEWVAVHDAARPLASPDLMGRVIASARQSGAALPALPVSDTLKRSVDGLCTLETVERSTLYGVQTPQVFRRDLLVEAYRSARRAGVAATDDAAYVELLGHPNTHVPGDRRNLKITLSEDLEMAAALLERQVTRVGLGYDVHRLVSGRPLVLGGVELEHPEGLGLDGHSDADVLLHAIADALLGAAALADIGEHFPNTDPRYRSVSSLLLLAHVASLVRAEGWEIVHVDAMLIAERPKIRPYVAEMRRHVGQALGVSPEQVSVKATTNERLGFPGREEGMAAQAVATLRR